MEKKQTIPADPYTLLRSRIVELELLPGALLSENSLGTQLGTGRAPVRQALARLSGEGCVETLPQRGTRVSLISIERARQALFLRTVLEQSVLRQLCASGLTGQQLTTLQESMDRQRTLLENRDVPALLREDDELHRSFFRFAGRLTAWEAAAAMDADLKRLRCLRLHTYNYKQAAMAWFDSWADGITEHRMLFDALRKQDAEAAALLCGLHLGRVEHDALELRRIYPQYFTAEALADTAP